MKVGDKVRIRTGKRGNPPRGEVLDIFYFEDEPGKPELCARLMRKGIGEDIWPIDCLTVVEDEGYPA